MGWIERPAYFCSVTETVADLMNNRLRSGNLTTSAHKLDSVTDSPPEPIPVPTPASDPAVQLPVPTVRSHGPLQHPLAYTDLFMDDFCQLVQGPPELQTQVRRTLFECLDAVIRPLEPADNPNRKEPNSMKKLRKGDACWAT